MNNTIQIEEKTEIEDTFCPFINGKCRLDCKFLIDIESGCMIEQAYRNTETLIEDMEERETVNPIMAQYAE